MYNLSFKNRIAFNYIISTALLVLIAFASIYIVVYVSVSNHLDNDLDSEVEKHKKEIKVANNMIALKQHAEWMEREHNTIGVDPVFIEFLSSTGHLIDKSPNLKGHQLLYTPQKVDNIFFDSKLDDKSIRQVQVPIFDKGEKVGYLLVAVSLEGQKVVLDTLFIILLITYPLILIVLFFVARFIVGESIKPINNIIETSNEITRDNLAVRISLPQNKDELFILSETINKLLDRVESAIEREQSFSSYASHEFRTPLAILKGTLEVLIRKPRTQNEYEDKINLCIKEVDRLNILIDQLLLLARFENHKKTLKLEILTLKSIIDTSIDRLADRIKNKNISIIYDLSDDIEIKTDLYLFSVILNNILSNAVKYSQEKGLVKIEIKPEKDKIILHIVDNGIGIAENDLNLIFDEFYRSHANSFPQIKGFGLGLAIVKRFCNLLHISLEVSSKEGIGTEVRLLIPYK